ncbi:MAG: hypothetical protein ACXVXC_10425 [Nocardioidaceae bacterium]
MMLHIDQPGTVSDASRAQVAVRLLGEFRHIKASTIIKTVSECDRLFPAEPGYVIERAARERLRATA